MPRECGEQLPSEHDGEGYCPICRRCHEEDEPCPKRIALVYLNLEPSQTLTAADLEWTEKHTKQDILIVLEEEIANWMEEESNEQLAKS